MIFNEFNYLGTRWKIGGKVEYSKFRPGSFWPGRAEAVRGIITNISLKDTFPIKVKWAIGYENRYNVCDLKLN